MNQERYRVKVVSVDWFQRNIKCQSACPASTSAHRYISLIAEGKYQEAYALNRMANVFPSILGRICTHPCEAACRRGEIDEPVSICALKRFAADWMLKSKAKLCKEISKSKSQCEVTDAWRFAGLTVAIIGAGPAGLTAAHDLALFGYRVTVFEALPVVGGMLRVGIPAYRLPRELIGQEVLAIMQALGVQIKLNTPIGKGITLTDLIDEFDAVFIATGAHQPIKLGIEGEDFQGVYHGVTFMRLVNLNERIEIGSRVVVIGGSFTAIDCARSAVRIGASEVSIVYRRTGAEMPAGQEEIDEAEAEGIQIQYLISPRRILSSDGKRVTALECIRNRLGEPDSSGRRRPIPIEGSQFTIDADTVIPAISQSPDISFLPEESRFELSKWDTLAVDAETFMTNLPGVFAGGDFTTGPRNVIEVISDGHKAATSIDRFLTKKRNRIPLTQWTHADREPSHPTDAVRVRLLGSWLKMERDYDSTRRQKMPILPLKQRLGLDDEVELGFSEETAKLEAKRCLKCNLNIHIDGEACVLCGGCVDVCPYDCIRMVSLDRLDSEEDIPQLQEAKSWQNSAAMILNERRCIRCGLCETRCPTGAITIEAFELS